MLTMTRRTEQALVGRAASPGRSRPRRAPARPCRPASRAAARAPARSRNAYSPGSGAGPASTMTLSLPSSRSARCIASSEPSASPSGFSCEVTTKRSWPRRASTTALHVSRLRHRSGLFGAGVELVDQLRHPDAVLDRRDRIAKSELRRPPQMELAVDARLQDAGRARRARRGVREPLLLAAVARSARPSPARDRRSSRRR